MTNQTIIAWFTANFPQYVKDLKGADHNYDIDNVNPFHQEGDCWSHTMIVYRQAQMLSTDPVVHWAALLHDLGKPLTREVKEETKRVRFFGHEGASAYMALDVLDAAATDGMFDRKDTATVFRLIARHTELFGRNIETSKQLRRMADSLGDDVKFFYQLTELANADSMGRLVDPDLGGSQGLDETKMGYIEDTFNDNIHIPLDPDAPKLIVLVGPPLSGKTTWKEELHYAQASTNAIRKTLIICRDDLLMAMYGLDKTYQEAWEAADQKKVDAELRSCFIEAIQQRRDIIIDMTNMSGKARRKWVSQVPKEYVKEAVVFMTSYQQLLIRNDMRQQSEGKFIPIQIINSMIARYTDPGYNEFDIISYVDGFGGSLV